MRRVLLLQIDGTGPNLALMRLSSWHREQGHAVEFRHAPNVGSVERGLFDAPYDRVYASAIFERSRPICRRLLDVRPSAIVGGSGWNENAKLSDVGCPADQKPDYSMYPNYKNSIGFTQRGCRLKCEFCKVARMEGKVTKSASVWDIWRGEPYPRNLLLLDNDFFGEPSWRDEIAAINEGGFKVCWNQGFNVRLIGDEEAAAIASTDYREPIHFKEKRLYTAWDNRKDEHRLFRNLELLVQHGVRPDDINVYMLVGFWDGPRLTEDDFYRHKRLREFGCRPYPMPYVRGKKGEKGHELVRFQTWIVGAYDKRVTWEEWKQADGRPEKVGLANDPGLFEEAA